MNLLDQWTEQTSDLDTNILKSFEQIELGLMSDARKIIEKQFYITSPVKVVSRVYELADEHLGQDGQFKKLRVLLKLN